MGNVHRVRYCISLYAEYKLSISCDMESFQPDEFLYDTESLQPYISICNPVTVYIVLVELIIPGGLETTTPQQPVSHRDLSLLYVRPIRHVY